MFDSSLTSVSAATTLPATQPQLPNDSDRRRVLYIEDLYDPDTVADSDASKYLVGRVSELVVDVTNKIIYYISAVADQSGKYKPTLVVWDRIGASEEDSNYDILGLPGGFQGQPTLGVDYSVEPPRAEIDRTVWCADAAYALLYKGDVVANENIISARYNSALDLIDNHVPVSLAASDALTNKTIMVPGSFNVTLNSDELPDGSRATVVFYDQSGNPLRNAQLLNVQHTALLKDHQIGIKYITGIELQVPWFMDSTDPTQLNIPINVAFKTVELRALVYYSDGTTRTQVIDGTKCYLLGWNQYRPTTVGQKENIVLVYSLDDDEQSNIADGGSAYQIRKKYNLVAVQADGAYSPKIFTYPYWDTNGWSLKHFLYDLERGKGIDVTPYVTLNESSPSFKSNTYGIEQNMIFNLLLSDVSAEYKAWTHVQYTTITLYADASKLGRHWDIRYNYTGIPYVGFNVKSSIINGVQNINLAGTFADQDSWLNRLYTLVQPLVNSYTETVAPTPNFGELLTLSGTKVRFAVSDYNKNIALSETIAEGQTVFIRWISQDDAGNELQLGITGVTATASPSNSDSDNGTDTTVIGYVADADFTLDKSEMLAGDTVVATAIARDSNGTAIPNVQVAFTPSDGYPTTVLSDASGKAIATIELSAVGTRTMVAATSKGQTTPEQIVVVPSSASIKQDSLVVPTDSVKVGAAYTLSCVVIDRDGNPLPDITVSFQVGGSNNLSAKGITDATGTATVSVTPTNPGSDTVNAVIITGSTLQGTVVVTS